MLRQGFDEFSLPGPVLGCSMRRMFETGIVHVDKIEKITGVLLP